MKEMLDYQEMERRTVDFYKSVGIDLNKEDFRLAIRSLTMPQYAGCYKDKNNGAEIGDHRALSTVGDAFIGAFIMRQSYTDDSTQESLTLEKGKAENGELNIIGKELLEGKLFEYNNDLDDKNLKSYATAFESVVGFIGLKYETKLKQFLKDWLSL